MYKRKSFKLMTIALSLSMILSMGFVLSACATTQGDTPTASTQEPGIVPPQGGPGSPGSPEEAEAPYKLIAITMEMEAGAAQYEAWPGGGKTIHSGIGWLHPFGRGEYVAGMDYPEAKTYPAPSYFNEEWMSTFKTQLFCIYRLQDGNIYAYDGLVGNLSPELEDGDDGKIDYVINVIVGGTGAYEGATGMLVGRTPGRGANTDISEGVSLPVSILKLMEGYIKIPEK